MGGQRGGCDYLTEVVDEGWEDKEVDATISIGELITISDELVAKEVEEEDANDVTIIEWQEKKTGCGGGWCSGGGG